MENEDEERRYRVTGDNVGGSSVPPNIMWGDSEIIKYKSWIIPTFLVVNLVLFILTMYTNNCPSHGRGGRDGCIMGRFLGRFSYEPYRQNPLLGPSSQTLLKMGAVNGATVMHHHQGWRLITSIWLHTGLIHLLVNIVSLLVLGIRLEQQFGFVKTATIYLLAGIGGNIVSCLLTANQVSVGASSALLGLIGAMYSELFTNWTTYTNQVAAVFTLLITLIINAVVVIVPYHGHFSHVTGGFLTGFLLGFMLLAKPIPYVRWFSRQDDITDINTSDVVTSKYKPYQYVLGITSLVLLIIGYIVGLVMLFHTKAEK